MGRMTDVTMVTLISGRPVPTSDLENKLTNFHGLPDVRCRNCTSAPSWRAGVSHSMRTCPADPDTLMSLGGGSYLTVSRDGVWGGEVSMDVSCWS